MTNLRPSSHLSQRAGYVEEDVTADQGFRHVAAGNGQVFFHFDFLRSLQMHRRLALGILLVATLLSLGYTVRRWNTWKAESLVYVQPSPHPVIQSGPSQQWPYDANTYESYIQQQVHDVTRTDVLAGAVKRLPGWQKASESDAAAAERLNRAVEVVRVGTAYEISITATGSSAADAAQTANAVASSYIDNATRELRAGDPQRIDLLHEERDRILKDLAIDRAEEEDLSRKLGVANVSASTPNPIDDQITQTRAELVKARTAHDEAAAKLTSLAGSKTSSAALDAAADELVAADPGLVSMKTALNKRRSDLISQMANLTPNHPQYKQDADELAKINTELEGMSKDLRAKAGARIEQNLKSDLERTASVEAQLNGQLAQLTGAAGSAAPRLQRSTELAADMQRLQNRYAIVDEQYRNLTMENNAPGAVYLAAAAQPPLHAARGKVLRNAFILLLAGVVFAIGAAMAAHNFDPKVYSALDVERVLGFPPMAQIPDLAQVTAGVADEYLLRVAAALEHAHQEGTVSSCIFTGVATGAGATTISNRVNKMLEAMGRETVLVDAAGSTAQLPEGSSPAGSSLMHAPRGSRSTALLQRMHQQADEDTVVVTDTAPLLISGETEYLARFVDAAIIVVESGVTTKAQLREVAKTLQRVEISSVGFVLNRVKLNQASASFLHSVRAVEEHLGGQTRPIENRAAEAAAAFPKHTQAAPAAFERLWSMVSETSSEAEDIAASQSEHAVPEEHLPASFNQHVSYAAESQWPSHPVPEPEFVAAVPAPNEHATGREQFAEPLFSREAASRPAVQPQSRPAVEISRSVPEREATPASSFASAPAHPGPAFVRAASEHGYSTQTPEIAWDTASTVPIEHPVAEQPIRIAAPQQAPAVVMPAATQSAPLTAPKQSIPLPAESQKPAQSPVPSTALVARSQELPPRAASRLGGLRNLMNSLGISDLHRGYEQRKTSTDAQMEPKQGVERTIYAQPASSNETTDPKEVVVLGEIISPVVHEHNEREKDEVRPAKTPRVSRWETPDDVETLPARRGQYRKRR